MPTVAFIGASSGKMIFQKTCQVLAPSSRADSSSSVGQRADEGDVQQRDEGDPADDVQDRHADRAVDASSAVCRISGRMITGNGMNIADSR